MSISVTARICMYRLHELGDCFLVTFAGDGAISRMLVDCGSFRNGPKSVARLQKVVKAIAQELDGAPIDVVVGTHQHNDHLSGFVHCEQEFRRIGIEQVWLSWLDNPADRRARRIGRVHHQLALQLHAVRSTLRASLSGRIASRPRAARSLEVLNDILGFYGASGPPPELPARAVEILKQIGARPPLYLEPGRTLEMPGLPEGAVRVHVLGPPTGEKDLHRTDPRRSESYDHSLARATALARRFLEASRAQGGASSPDAADYPFNSRYRRSGRPPAALRTLIARYQSLEEAWRTIGDDWLDQAESLALYLDEFTNNSSLVLAIELAGSGKVLLFAADAQTGNWESWAGVKWREPGVTTDDLLSRTVVYKVGHHASHNATLAPVFERLGGNNLVALIPVHKKDPNILKQNGWKMPAKNLFKRLKERTGGRVLQMDGLNPDGCDPDVQPAKGSWKRIGIKPHITDIGIEIEI